MTKKPKIIAWDIEETLIPQSEINSDKGDRVVRGNALELLTRDPVIKLNGGVISIFETTQKLSIPNGVISGFAYQFGINLISASKARDYIDPKLIELSHKYAWEGMVLDGKDYDKILEEWNKPSIKMYDSLLQKANYNFGEEVDPRDCLYIGDNEKDECASREAKWQYSDINNINEILKKIS